MRRMTADIFARVLRRLEAGDSVPQAARAEDVTPGQVRGRLRKTGMTGEHYPAPRPVSAADLDRLLYPHDPPLTQRMLDYLTAFDAYLCDRNSPEKFVAWRVSAHDLIGDRIDEPPMEIEALRAIADAANKRRQE